MTKQTINIGTPDKGDGDPLRTAFTKVNANFTELYTALGLTDNNLNLGSFEFTDNIITTTDSSNIIIDQAVTITSELTVQGDIVPNIANEHTLGTPAKPFKSLYVSTSTIYLGNTALSLDPNTNELKINNVPLSQTDNVPTDVADLTDTQGLLGGAANLGSFKISGSTLGTVDDPNTGGWGTYDMYLDPGGESQAYLYIPGLPGQQAGNSLQIFNKGDATSIVQVFGQGGVQVVTNTGEGEEIFEFRDDGKLQLPPGGDILDSDGDSVLGGAAGPVQPYLELINTPFITQPAVLGTLVTVTVPNSGQNGSIDLVITEGPTIDINNVVISAPGTGYVVGQRYKIWYYDVGGSNIDGNIEFTVDSVGDNGELLAVTNLAFAGGGADNGADTYLNRSFQLQAWIFDQINVGLTLARDGNQGIYNSESESEYDNNTYLSPLGTEWNSDGWGNLLELGTRSYTTWRQALNNQVGNNILASELVMHDIANDKYYKFDFTAWNGSNGGYSYTRTEVTDPNYFRKPHNAENNAVDIIEDDSTLQIGITRTDSTGIYNPFTEQGFSDATSPAGTTWNADGWDDLTDLTTRTYTNFNAAAGGYNNVLGKKFVMYVSSIQKYYAIEFLEWDTTGNNNFAYVRYEIDQTKLNEGITFADGTVLKSAAGVGRVKSTAAGDRRIEEVTGYNQVSVTSRVTNNYVGSISQTSNGYELRIARTIELDAVLQPIFNGTVNATFTLSFDNAVYREVWLSSIQETEYWFYYQVDFGQTTPQTEGDTVYLEVITGADPVTWWDKADLPGGSQDFRGAVIDYHAYTGESTIIGTIHIVDDDGEEHISHQEVQSGSTDGENDDLWLVSTEGQIRYRRIDGESKTLKIHWTAKVFYGSELYD